MADGLKEIIDSLERQRAAIENALSALRGIEEVGQQQQSSPATSTRQRGPAKRKGGMTPEGRRRLAEAMKRRWAAKRTAAQARKSSGKRAGRKAAA
jgi:ParB-like chromosome segregation protein Spo0J